MFHQLFHLAFVDSAFVPCLRGWQKIQTGITFVANQRLLDAAASFHDVYKIVYNPVFQSHDDIQIPQTDIGIDQYNLSSSRRQTGSDVCGRRCFSDTAFS